MPDVIHDVNVSILSHPGFLFFTSPRAAIFRACLVELPCHIERESATGRVVHGEVTITEEDGIGLVGIEEINAAQIEGQRTETAQVEIFLQSKNRDDTRVGYTEVIVFSLRGPLQVSTQAEIVRQQERVPPGAIEPRLTERDYLACGGWRFVILEHGDKRPSRMPTADGGPCGGNDCKAVVILLTVDGAHEAHERVG